MARCQERKLHRAAEHISPFQWASLGWGVVTVVVTGTHYLTLFLTESEVGDNRYHPFTEEGEIKRLSQGHPVSGNMELEPGQSDSW